MAPRTLHRQPARRHEATDLHHRLPLLRDGRRQREHGFAGQTLLVPIESRSFGCDELLGRV